MIVLPLNMPKEWSWTLARAFGFSLNKHLLIFYCAFGTGLGAREGRWGEWTLEKNDFGQIE